MASRVKAGSFFFFLALPFLSLVGFGLCFFGDRTAARRQAVADLDQGRGERARVARHVAGEAIGVILAAAAEPQDDILAGDVQDISPDGDRDPVTVVLAPAAGLQRRAVQEVKQQRHEMDDRHQDHIPVLAVADLVGDDPLDLRGLEQVENALSDHDPHVVGVVPVGEGIGRSIVNQARTRGISCSVRRPPARRSRAGGEATGRAGATRTCRSTAARGPSARDRARTARG